MRIVKLTVRAFVFAALLFATANVTQASDEFVVIVNTTSDWNQMDRVEVRSHYLLKIQRWKSHDKVKPVDQEERSGVREAFLANVLKMNSAGLKRHWIQQQYQTAARPAVVVDGDTAVVEYVASNKGAIGFVRRGSLQSSKRVKAVHAF